MAKVVDEITFRFYSPEDLPESGRKVLAYLKGGELVSGATTSKRYFFTGGDSENEVLYCTEEQFRENPGAIATFRKLQKERQHDKRRNQKQTDKIIRL